MNFSLIKEITIKQKGQQQYGEYRIPAICALSDGTLLSCFECRREAHNDWARIDICLIRSSDGFSSWSEYMIADSSGDVTDTTWNNPTLISDGFRAHLLYCRDYARAYHIQSEDGGITWSEPDEITGAFNGFDYRWNVCAIGPGHGIRAQDGTLYAPIWLANGSVNAQNPRVRAHMPSIAGIIKSVGGSAWATGALALGIDDGNETTVVETKNGDLLLNIRNRGAVLQRALVRYLKVQGKCTDARLHSGLIDPMCFGSMIRLDDGHILFSNCASERDRNFLTISISADDGATWEKALLVDETGGYSDIAVFGNTLYVLYERTVCGEIAELRLKIYDMRETL